MTLAHKYKSVKDWFDHEEVWMDVKETPLYVHTDSKIVFSPKVPSKTFLVFTRYNKMFLVYVLKDTLRFSCKSQTKPDSVWTLDEMQTITQWLIIDHPTNNTNGR